MSARFSCSACGREYPWKPELAGRSAKCKCGQVLHVPATAPAEPEPEPDVLDFADDPVPAEPVKAKPLVKAGGAAAAAAPKAAVAKPKAPPAAQSSGQRCPSCQSDMTPGAPICINCGFDLRTGKHVQTAVEADAPVAATPAKAKAKGGKAAAKGKSKGRGAVDEGGSNTKQIIVVVLLAVLAIGGIFAAKSFFKKDDGTTGPGGGPALGDDAQAVRMLKDNEPIEGKEFVDSHPSRTLGITWTNAQSRNRVQSWYDMGVAKVWAFSGQISRHVVFELPTDGEKRAKIFDWVGNWYTDQQKDRPKDVGQKYLILDMH
jgi:hypothetical protein